MREGLDDNGRALISALVEEGVDADLQEFGESFMDLPESPDDLFVPEREGDFVELKVVGCAKLRYVGPYKGSLGRMSAQRRAMVSSSLYDVATMQFLEVLGAHRFREAVTLVHTGYGMEAPKSDVIELTHPCTQRLLMAMLLIVGGDQAAHEVIEYWHRGGATLHVDSCLRMQNVYAKLVVSGLWKDLAFHYRARAMKGCSIHEHWRRCVRQTTDEAIQRKAMITAQAAEMERYDENDPGG